MKQKLVGLSRWLLGAMVLLTIGLIILGSQVEPRLARADDVAESPAATANEAAPEASQGPYLPEAEGVDAQRQARYEQKRSQDQGNNQGRLISLLGILGFIGIAFAMSSNRKAVSWRLVSIGVALQMGFALFILWTPIGKQIFSVLNDVVTRLLDFTMEGTAFLLGDLVTNHFTIAFNVLTTIIFFSSLMTVLYFLGVMQWIVRGLSMVMQRLMGTSGAETLSATANIFVGQTEAPLVIKPYVDKMTRSELMVVMTGGFATVAGGVLAAYVGLLRNDFPDIAGHLIAASVMSAPAALVIAKIMIPETETPVTLGNAKLEEDEAPEDANIIDAAARGASEGLKLAVNVGAMLLAFIALVAMINFLIGLPSYMKNQGEFERVHHYTASAAIQLPNPGGCADPQTPSAKYWCDHAQTLQLDQRAVCKDPGSNGDMIWCTHKDLLALAIAYDITVPEKLQTLSRDLSGKDKPHEADNDRDAVESLGALVTEKIKDAPPLELLRRAPKQTAHPTAAHPDDTLAACESGRVAACGAVLALTQSDRWTESLAGPDFWSSISLEVLLGWIFFPLAWLMGVPWAECQLVGQLLGQKLVLNEFFAYMNLSALMEEGLLSYRSIVICTYALCGFANFGSIAIQIGGIGGIAPNRRHDLAKLGVRAMIGGTLAAFMTATIAGALIN